MVSIIHLTQYFTVYVIESPSEGRALASNTRDARLWTKRDGGRLNLKHVGRESLIFTSLTILFQPKSTFARAIVQQ